MAASTWTWLGNSDAPSLPGNWQLTSGTGNASNIPAPGDTEIFNGAGVPPLFVDASISDVAIDLIAAGTVAFANDTTSASTTSLDPTVSVVAAGTATAMRISGTFDNAGTIEVNGTADALAIGISPEGTLAGLFRNDGQIIVGSGDTLGVTGAALLNFGGIETSGTLLADAITEEGAGGLTVTVGSVTVNSLTEDAGGTIAIGGGAVSVNGTAVVGQTGTGASITLTGGGVTAAALSVGQMAGGSGTVTVNGGQLGVSGPLHIGDLGTGEVTVNAGAALAASGGIVLQAGGGSGTGTLVDNGGLMIVSGPFTEGTGGAALAIVEAGAILSLIGTAATDKLQVGSNTMGGASLAVDGAVATASNEAMTVGAGSVLISDAGTIATTSRASGPAIDVNADGGARAIVQVKDSGSAWNLNSSGSRFIIGDTGNGAVSVTGGAVVNAGSNTVELGDQAGGAGTVAVGPAGSFRAATPSASAAALDIGVAAGATGGVAVSGTNAALTATGQVIVGDSGLGALEIASQAVARTGGGTVTPSLGVDIAKQAGGLGFVSVSGVATQLINTGGFIVGDAGDGSLSVQSGATVTTSPGTAADIAGMSVGNAASSEGAIVSVTGAGTQLNVAGLLDVGVAGSGGLQVSAGGTVLADSLDAGGSAAATGQIGVTGVGSALIVTNDATVADDGTGVLSVLDGASFTASSLTIGSLGDSSGALVVSGAGSVVQLSGALNIGTALGTGDLTVGPNAAVHASVVSLQGQVVLEGGLLDPTVNLINQGQTAGGFGTIAAGMIVDEGVIQAGGTKPSQRLLIVQGTVLGGGALSKNSAVQPSAAAGVLQINAGGTLELTGAVLNTSTAFTDNLTPAGTYSVSNSVVDVSFADAAGVLLLDDIAGFTGTIASFVAGDRFVISGGTLSAPGVSNGDTVTFADSGAGAGTGGVDRIMFASPVNAGQFSIVNGDTVLAVACFAAGTRIATDHGPMAVERLAVGDGLLTADGRVERIVWIGTRTVDCRRHPQPETVWPVRISAGAFGEKLPARDLYLSPDHAVFVDDVLVPVKRLINGSTIVQMPRPTIAYHHVELRRHDVILAEGLPAESYLDMEDRSKFANGAGIVRLFPDFSTRAVDAAIVWEERGCAPLVMAGPVLETVRSGLNRRAATIAARSARLAARRGF